MNKTHYILVFLALPPIFFASGCSQEDAPQREILRPVRYQEVQGTGEDKIRAFSGVSVAASETKLSFRINGTLETVQVKVGQKVEKSALIAALDDADLQLNYEEAGAAVKNAEVQKDHARASLSRTRELYENNHVSLSEYEQAKNQSAAAQAEYDARRKQLDLQRSQLNYSKLYSPMTGIVEEVPVAKNENVTAGEVIAVLTSSEDIEVEVGIPEAYIARIQSGTSATVSFSSLPGQSFAGLVTEVSYAASGYSTYPIKVRLEQISQALRPGMPATVVFSFPSADPVGLRVAVSAVAEDQQGNYVFVVKESAELGLGVVERRRVVVGELTNQGFVVREGLQEGESVVISGVSKITDGMQVRFLK